MLRELHISDFAIIEQLSLHLDRGLTVLTGETGAGKSIIIDALGALRGEKVGSDWVRSGRPRARIEGVFHLADCPAVIPLLRAYGLDDQDAESGGELPRKQDDDLLILTREISAERSRSIARINRRPVNLSILREIGEHLFDIHGQHEGGSLFNPHTHLDMLDRYGGLMAARERVGALVAQVQQVRDELAMLRHDEVQRQKRLEELREFLQDIREAHLVPDEELLLAQERSILQNASRIAELIATAYHLLSVSEHEPALARPVIEGMGRVMVSLGELATLDPAARSLAEQAADIHYRIEDLISNLRAYRDAFDFNPQRLEAIEDRLFLVRRLQRKYGGSVATLLERAAAAEQEMDRLSHRDTYLASLEAREQAMLAELATAAWELSQQRRATALELAKAIETAMSELAMPHIRFAVRIEHIEDPRGIPVHHCSPPRTYRVSPTGIDQVEFLITPNPGEPLKPLTRIASGGESSRLLLAIKSILSRVDAIPTLVFDEIDVGVGGRAGQIVGQKLWSMTDSHQVICITHLPQVAAFADAHYVVSKQVVRSSPGGSLQTRTSVRRLSPDERIDEIAAMLGGIPMSSHSRANASEMIQRAAMFKSEGKRLCSNKPE